MAPTIPPISAAVMPGIVTNPVVAIASVLDGEGDEGEEAALAMVEEGGELVALAVVGEKVVAAAAGVREIVDEGRVVETCNAGMVVTGSGTVTVIPLTLKSADPEAPP